LGFNNLLLDNERTAAKGRLLLPPAITGADIMPIRRYLEDNAVFEPDAIKAMSEALEQVCTALQINGQIRDRETVASRIIDLARNGVTDAKTLSERVIAETRAMHAL